MREIFLAPHQLGVGGRTTAVFAQAEMFLRLGLAPTVLTFNYDGRFESSIASRRASSQIPDGVRVRNIYLDLMEQNSVPGEANWSMAEDDEVDGLIEQDDLFEKDRFIRYFDRHGEYIKFRRWDGGGAPVQTTYFQARRAVVRREYNSAGFCGLEYHYDLVTGKVNQERYYTADGFCYLARWINPNSGAHAGLYVNSREVGKSRRFAHNVPWHVDWLEGLMKGAAGRPTLVAHSSGAARKVIDVKPGLADRVFVWHENHFKPPFRFGADIRDDYADTFKRFAEMPAVVVATEAQAADLRRRYPDAHNVHVVPNRIRTAPTVEGAEKAEGRIGVFSRLHPGKRIDQLIRIIPAIRKAIPAANLHVYGRGPERAALENLTRELSLDDYVTFHGQISDVSAAMSRCQVTVSTSEVESFGLAIGESLAAGTPVVAYDINYGPSDQIRDGVDGRLVPDNKPKQLTKRLIEVLSDPERAAVMGTSGRERMADQFGHATVVARWRHLLDIDGESQV
ncbi:glycosyltransferase [Pseudactinotalea sp. HY158]|uniref:glycosyltransferase n=1 Tax=Pseudactinotalea sp. HY158 TaxID=2654547 RepID=UPI00129C141F|nr:glycosyltransferase [Pseudactinotalea sp. HY158]QGH70081.1 glycosyltransferase [Pseudactinotalea sp. HY158]